MQNIIFDGLKDRLQKHFRGLGDRWADFQVVFQAKAKAAEAYSILKITVPTQSANGQGKYDLESLYLSLADGKMQIDTDRRYTLDDVQLLPQNGRTLPHCAKDSPDVPIPHFADPSFDPDLLFDFAVLAITRMDSLRDVCAGLRRQIDALNTRIAAAKSATFDEFSSIWQSVWFGD